MLVVQPLIVYYPHMPSIVGKRRGKQAYYYLVESARESGLGFVGSLPRRSTRTCSGCPVRSAYKPVDADRYPGLTCVDTHVTALGVTQHQGLR